MAFVERFDNGSVLTIGAFAFKQDQRYSVLFMERFPDGFPMHQDKQQERRFVDAYKTKD